MKTPLWTKVSLLALVVLLLGANACGKGGADRVIVLASWTGAEEDDFRTVLRAFTAATGIEFDYHGTRALDQVLATDVRHGTTPDVAVLPNPGSLAAYARGGKLQPLDTLLGPQPGYPQQWRDLEKAGTGRQYAVAVKADLKSAIWYDVTFPSGPKPGTWDGLLALSRKFSTPDRTPWCLGMGPPPTSGWPGTDWIEDILLHSAGPEIYRQWVAGELPWTSRPVAEAWEAWGRLVMPPGVVRAPAALLTDFGDAGRGLFTRPIGCLLEHQASFAMRGYLGMKRPDGTAPRPERDFDFFAFPRFSPETPDVSEVSADLAAMFHDTPQARELMKYLASDEAQRIWPGLHQGSVFSIDRNVGGVYDDSVSRKVSSKLTPQKQDQRLLCFDASDLMPATMTAAFYRAVLEYLAGAEPLDQLLKSLELVHKSIPADEWLNVPCGQSKESK